MPITTNFLLAAGLLLIFASSAQAFGSYVTSRFLPFPLSLSLSVCRGNIAEYTHQNGRAFRHGQPNKAPILCGQCSLAFAGDLEDVLLTLAKTMAGGAGLMGFIKQATGGSNGTKFSASCIPFACLKLKLRFTAKDDVAKIYFGNWCRDMSQAIDGE